MKIGSSPVCTTQVVKCFKTNEVFIMKSLSKKYLTTDVDKFRDLIIGYKENKYL